MQPSGHIPWLHRAGGLRLRTGPGNTPARPMPAVECRDGVAEPSDLEVEALGPEAGLGRAVLWNALPEGQAGRGGAAGALALLGPGAAWRPERQPVRHGAPGTSSGRLS